VTTGVTREQFLKLSWADQKATDFRKVFDADARDVNLTANCINPSHRDDSASMVIYANAVYCFGCKIRWWPDQFLCVIGDRALDTERGARKQEAPGTSRRHRWRRTAIGCGLARAPAWATTPTGRTSC
jgi:hypothetical protein